MARRRNWLLRCWPCLIILPLPLVSTLTNEVESASDWKVVSSDERALTESSVPIYTHARAA